MTAAERDPRRPAPASASSEVFTAVYRQYAAGLRGFVATIIMDRHLAEDVVHEAFLEFWHHTERYDPNRADVQSWLRTIAHRRAIDRIRSMEAAGARSIASAAWKPPVIGTSESEPATTTASTTAPTSGTHCSSAHACATRWQA